MTTFCLFFRIDEKEISEECAVKVFKTTLTDFKTRERYIREDYRFRDRMTKNNTQKVGLVIDGDILYDKNTNYKAISYIFSPISFSYIYKLKDKNHLTILALFL